MFKVLLVQKRFENPIQDSHIFTHSSALRSSLGNSAFIRVYPPPAKTTVEQAYKFAEALVRGEPNRDKIALTVLSDKVRELV